MTAIFSWIVRGGKRLVAVRARIVLPAPGGPERRRLWRPAMAISRARLAVDWPKIWSR